MAATTTKTSKRRRLKGLPWREVAPWFAKFAPADLELLADLAERMVARRGAVRP
jgi:hypothetical protein